MKKSIVLGLIVFLFALLLVSSYTADSYDAVQSTLDTGYTADSYNKIDLVLSVGVDVYLLDYNITPDEPLVSDDLKFNITCGDSEDKSGITYQEDADNTVCTVVWNVSQPCTNVFDNDWDTFGMDNESPNGYSYVYENFTKPIDSISATWMVARFQVGVGINTSNFTIPSSCFSQSNLQLSLGSIVISNAYGVFACYNGTNWETVFDGTGGTNVGAGRIYEDAIYWETSGITGYVEVFQEGDSFSNYSMAVANNTNTILLTVGSGNTSAAEIWNGSFWCGDGTYNTSVGYDNVTIVSGTDINVTLSTGIGEVRYRPNWGTGTTAFDVEPDNQTDLLGVFTAINNGTIHGNITIRWNDTYTNVFTECACNNFTSDMINLTTSYQKLCNLSISAQTYVWCRRDYKAIPTKKVVAIYFNMTE